VKNVHGLRASGDVDYTPGAARLRNANLFDTLADSGHWLEVIGLVPPLDLVELITRIVPGVLREVSQTFQRVAKEAHRPHGLIISERI
jgi:hypothetical protein